MSLPLFFFFKRRLSVHFNPYTNPWLHNLTPKGRAQSRAAAKTLERMVDGSAVVVSSDAPRARQTASYISTRLSVERYSCSELREREMNYWAGWFIESGKSAADRFGRKLGVLAQVYANKSSLIVVSHLHVMMGYLSGVNADGYPVDVSLRNGEIIYGQFKSGAFTMEGRINSVNE